MPQEINVIIGRVGGTQYGAWWFDPTGIGVVCAFHKTREGLEKEFAKELGRTVQEWIDHGEKVPDYLRAHDYTLLYYLDASTLFHEALKYTTLGAISRATSMTCRQLEEYVRGDREPRPSQRARIVEGLRHIASRLASLE